MILERQQLLTACLILWFVQVPQIAKRSIFLFQLIFLLNMQMANKHMKRCSTSLIIQFNSVTQSWPHESQHARPPCPSPTPGVYSNSSPSSQWCHPAISSSVVPISSCTQSLPAAGAFPMSQLFTWGGQRIGVSTLASVLPMNTQDWSPLGWTDWISL